MSIWKTYKRDLEFEDKQEWLEFEEMMDDIISRMPEIDRSDED